MKPKNVKREPERTDGKSKVLPLLLQQTPPPPLSIVRGIAISIRIDPPISKEDEVDIMMSLLNGITAKKYTIQYNKLFGAWLIKANKKVE